MWDYIIKNGYVVDGTGAPWFKGDLAIAEEKIADINRGLPASGADTVIDAKGLVVSPGFIDMHNHSEIPLVAYPTADSMVHQGVTLEYTCQCGTSGSGPLKGAALEAIKRRTSRAYDIDVDWTTLTEYMARFERQGCSINGAFQVGHGTVRLCVMGWENRAPTRDELEEMKALVAQTMEEGAFGLSTGLMYTPGNYAETEEVVELAKVAARYGGIHTSHDRRRGWESDLRGGRGFVTTTIDSEIWSVMEVVRIGEEGGLPTTWTHAKACGEVNWCRALDDWFKIIDIARRRGVDVGIDVYPWTYRGGIVRGFPTWAEEGGPEKMRERLRDPETRKRIRDYVKENMEGPTAEHTWDRALILQASEQDQDLVGKFMTEAAEMRRQGPPEAPALHGGHRRHGPARRQPLQDPPEELRDLPQDTEEVRPGGEGAQPRGGRQEDDVGGGHKAGHHGQGHPAARLPCGRHGLRSPQREGEGDLRRPHQAAGGNRVRLRELFSFHLDRGMVNIP